MRRFAGDVNIGSFMSDRQSYDKFGAMQVGEDAENDASQAMRNAYVADAGMRAQGLVARAEANADAIRAGGEARGQMYAASGLEGIGGVFGKAIRGGMDVGRVGNYSGLSSDFGAFKPGASFNVPSTFNAPSWR